MPDPAWSRPHLEPKLKLKLTDSNMFPGLGTAIVAFTAYVIYDDYIAKPKHVSHSASGSHH